MVPVLEASEMERSEPSGRGGRPRKQKLPITRKAGDSYELPNGLRIWADQDGQGYLIRLEGGRVDAEMVRVIMAAIHRMLQSTS